MAHEDLAQAKVNRGQRARHLLDDPVLNEALDALLADADKVCDQTKPNEVELREECYRAKQAIRALRKKLGYWLTDGTLEQMHLDELNAKEKRNAVQ